MIRKIIEIDKEKCNGCGLCAHACHEGAIGMVDGKATLLRDDYCDGLGNCLPVCQMCIRDRFDPTLYVITDSTYHTTETLLLSLIHISPARINCTERLIRRCCPQTPDLRVARHCYAAPA